MLLCCCRQLPGLSFPHLLASGLAPSNLPCDQMGDWLQSSLGYMPTPAKVLFG